MSNEEEDRAFEAIIVMALREPIDPIANPELLPELNDRDRAAMDALGDDLIERLWESGQPLVRSK